MIKKHLKEYIDTWKSIFDIKKRTTKINFNVFVCINFLCVLIIYNASQFSESLNFIKTIAILLFVLTFVFGAIKSGVPKITGRIFGKIVLAGILIGFLNVLVVWGYREIDSQGYGILIMMFLCITVYPIIVTISILFFNVFKKDKISDLELIIYSVVFSVTTFMITESTLSNMK
ncbi:hypothetical protein [Flavobacterium sp. FlaQc-48]|uniref:hypothetical protein n=1 Tax=Flavobacterium sp. FlaQc-48 TaxID=3374181 RepID=UPI003756B83A